MQNFDALYYNGHPDDCAPLIRNLQKEGFPLVTFAGNDETRNYRIDYTATGYETGKTLAKEKRIHFYSKDLDPYSGFLIGLEKGYAEYKCPLICKTFRNMDDLNLLLEERIPDVLFITAANDCKILDLLEEKNIDYKKQCRLVSYSPKMLDTRFCGIHLTPPEQEISSNITKDLLEMLNGKKLEIGTTAFPLKTKEICKKQ